MVLVRHHRRDVRGALLAQDDPRTIHRMALHDGPIRIVVGAGLDQHVAGDPDLSDIVKQAGHPHRSHRRGIEAHPLGEPDREHGDVARVGEGVLVEFLDGEQRQEQPPLAVHGEAERPDDRLRLGDGNPGAPGRLLLHPLDRGDLVRQRHRFGPAILGRLRAGRGGPVGHRPGELEHAEPGRGVGQLATLGGGGPGPGELIPDIVDEAEIGLRGHSGVELDALDLHRRELRRPLPARQLGHRPLTDDRLAAQEGELERGDVGENGEELLQRRVDGPLARRMAARIETHRGERLTQGEEIEGLGRHAAPFG